MQPLFAADAWEFLAGFERSIEYHAIENTSMRSIVYHQAADKCTLTRDEMQPQRG